MWSWMRVRARAASPASTASRMARCSARRRAAAASQSAMRVGARLDVGLDRGAQAGHHRGDDDVARRLGEREVQLGVEREELRGGQVGGIHRVEHGVRGVGRARSGSAASASTTADSSTRRVRTTSSSGKPLRGDLQPQQRRHAAPRGGDDDRAGCRTRAGAGADESHHLEHAQRLAHARAPDAERRGELALAAEADRRVRGGRRAGRTRSARARSATRAAGAVVVASMSPPLWSDHSTRMWSDHRKRSVRLIAWIPSSSSSSSRASTCAFCWIASLITKDTSWVDRIWSIVPVVYVWIFAIAGIVDGSDAARLIVMAVLVTAWGARLTFNFARKGGYTGMEDYRWAILRGRMKPWQFQLFNLFFIVLYQNALLVLITLPAYIAWQNPAPFGVWDAVVRGAVRRVPGRRVRRRPAAVELPPGEEGRRRARSSPASSRPGCSPTAATRTSSSSRRSGGRSTRSARRRPRHPASASGAACSTGRSLGAALLTLLFIGSTIFTESITVVEVPGLRRLSARAPRCSCRSPGAAASSEAPTAA